MLLTQLDKYKDPETSSYDQSSFTEMQGQKGRKIGRNTSILPPPPPPWYNSKLGNSSLFKKEWNSHGISVIGHIVKSDFQILKKDEIESTYNCHINNF